MLLLVNTVIIMTIARKVERVFNLIQFFSYLRKQGGLFSLGAFKRIHPWVSFNGLFDFCTLWNCKKIRDFLMVLGEGRSLTGFVWLKPFCMVELVLSLNSFCMVPLFWGCSTGVTLVLRWYVAVFRWCSG